MKLNSMFGGRVTIRRLGERLPITVFKGRSRDKLATIPELHLNTALADIPFLLQSEIELFTSGRRLLALGKVALIGRLRAHPIRGLGARGSRGRAFFTFNAAAFLC